MERLIHTKFDIYAYVPTLNNTTKNYLHRSTGSRISQIGILGSWAHRTFDSHRISYLGLCTNSKLLSTLNYTTKNYFFPPKFTFWCSSDAGNRRMHMSNNKKILLEFYDHIFISFLFLTDLDAVFNGLYWSLYVKLQEQTKNYGIPFKFACTLAFLVLCPCKMFENVKRNMLSYKNHCINDMTVLSSISLKKRKRAY